VPGSDAATLHDLRVKLTASDEARRREADARVAAEAELASLRSDARELSDRLEIERAAHVAVRREVGRLEAILAQEPSAQNTVKSADGHVAFLPSPSGYVLAERAGPALDVGSEEDLDGVRFLVARIGRSPLPADTRRCAYLEVA